MYLHKMCLMVWKRTFYGKVDLSTTCQCRQLKLNTLLTQINISCLMTNQMPALLVQRAPWTRAAVTLLQPLDFSHHRPFPPPGAIIPDARPLGTFENQDTRDGKTRYIQTISRKNRGLWTFRKLCCERTSQFYIIMFTFSVVVVDLPTDCI